MISVLFVKSNIPQTSSQSTKLFSFSVAHSDNVSKQRAFISRYTMCLNTFANNYKTCLSTFANKCTTCLNTFINNCTTCLNTFVSNYTTCLTSTFTSNCTNGDQIPFPSKVIFLRLPRYLIDPRSLF